MRSEARSMKNERELRDEIKRMEETAGCKASTWSVRHFPTFYIYYRALRWVLGEEGE